MSWQGHSVLAELQKHGQYQAYPEFKTLKTVSLTWILKPGNAMVLTQGYLGEHTGLLNNTPGLFGGIYRTEAHENQ